MYEEVLYLSHTRGRNLIIESLVTKQNALISAGKYTDGADDVLLKILQEKKQSILYIRQRKGIAFGVKNPLVVPFVLRNCQTMFNLSEQTLPIIIPISRIT